MALKGKITQSVNKAFKAVGDLAETVTLKSKSGSDYDFSTNSVTHTETTASVSAIVLYSDAATKEDNIVAPRKEVLIKESDLENPKLYDSITIKEINHSVVSYKHEPGLITLVVTEA